MRSLAKQFKHYILYTQLLYTSHSPEQVKNEVKSEVLEIVIKPGWKKGTKITFPEKGGT